MTNYRQRLRASAATLGNPSRVRWNVAIAVAMWLACVAVVIHSVRLNPEPPRNYPHGGTTGFILLSAAYWAAFTVVFMLVLNLLALLLMPLFNPKKRRMPPN